MAHEIDGYHLPCLFYTPATLLDRNPSYLLWQHCHKPMFSACSQTGENIKKNKKSLKSVASKECFLLSITRNILIETISLFLCWKSLLPQGGERSSDSWAQQTFSTSLRSQASTVTLRKHGEDKWSVGDGMSTLEGACKRGSCIFDGIAYANAFSSLFYVMRTAQTNFFSKHKAISCFFSLWPLVKGHIIKWCHVI